MDLLLHRPSRHFYIYLTTQMESGTNASPLRCYIMVTTSHIVLTHIQRVLMLAVLITYFAPMLGSVEAVLRTLAHVSLPSQENVTIAYEVMDTSAVTIDLD